MLKNSPWILHRRYSSSISQLFSRNKPLFVFQSTINDPYLNLSIEHYLFTNSPAGSKILFLYVNRPSVIIGRNQNPWIEVNLKALHVNNYDLVRRRSGGGAVYHDDGNVNWSITCDLPQFTRDKHAEMVVEALRGIGIEHSRVNKRHDIVLDQGTFRKSVNKKDTHISPFTDTEDNFLKVSGSAYKISRNRALHHGTALTNSVNVKNIGPILHSPYRDIITARGTDSVRTRVGILGISNEEFKAAVSQEFLKSNSMSDKDIPIIELGSECLEIQQVRNGYDELKSNAWLWEQTPSFECSIDLHNQGKFEIYSQNGAISNIKSHDSTDKSTDQTKTKLIGIKLFQLDKVHIELDDVILKKLIKQLQLIFPSK